MKTNDYLLSATILFSMAAAIGCGIPGKATGGGSMQSADFNPDHKATFGFNGQQCDASAPATGQLEYQDRHAVGFGGGVRLHAEVTSTEACVLSEGATPSDNCNTCRLDFGYAIGISYSSQNPRLPGSGSGVVCAIDQGEGSNAPDDYAAIVLLDGCYAGYVNGYWPVQGNIQSHECH